MNLRQNIMAILRYQPYDNFPVISFGFWRETVLKWAEEGHITQEEAEGYVKYGDNSPADHAIMKKLGFDFNWSSCFGAANDLFPHFKEEILETLPDGSRIKRDSQGLIVKDNPSIVSIPSEIGTSLTDRDAWETLYLPRLQLDAKRVNEKALAEIPRADKREYPLGLHCGSLIGRIRDFLGVEHLSYLYADDEELFCEIVKTIADISYDNLKTVLKSGADFDYAHYWEDICFKNGPLVAPSVFRDIIGPYYKQNSDLLNAHGIDIISVDCDGYIDFLLPTWMENGVNTMFPIEVGTWNANIAPWREKFGKELRGVGGMNKTVFAHDFAAVDVEVARLKTLVELGGYIPCPDHRIAPDAKFENVQYYCEKIREACNK